MHNIIIEYIKATVRGGHTMEEKNTRRNSGWIVGGIIAFVTVCATAAFFLYHAIQERKRNERWRHYDDKYLDE